MTTWFRFSKYRDVIEPIAVIRETKEFLVIAGGRERRESKDVYTYPTKGEALVALVSHRAEKVNRLRENLREAEASHLACRKMRGDFE